MNGADTRTFADIHKQVWGNRPALFMSRWGGLCCWCGGEVIAGDDACYWPEHDARIGHEACLRIVTLAEA